MPSLRIDLKSKVAECDVTQVAEAIKDREIRELGEYRTKRLVLEAWDSFGFDN